MNLREYLKQNNLTISAFADQIEYNRSHLSLVLSGERKAGKKLSRDIERATNGQVKAHEIVSHDQKKFDANVKSFISSQTVKIKKEKIGANQSSLNRHTHTSNTSWRSTKPLRQTPRMNAMEDVNLNKTNWSCTSSLIGLLLDGKNFSYFFAKSYLSISFLISYSEKNLFISSKFLTYKNLCLNNLNKI